MSENPEEGDQTAKNPMKWWEVEDARREGRGLGEDM
jgi:hypothetical protein